MRRVFRRARFIHSDVWNWDYIFSEDLPCIMVTDNRWSDSVLEFHFSISWWPSAVAFEYDNDIAFKFISEVVQTPGEHVGTVLGDLK